MPDLVDGFLLLPDKLPFRVYGIFLQKISAEKEERSIFMCS
jgi:hypothetical protein